MLCSLLNLLISYCFERCTYYAFIDLDTKSVKHELFQTFFQVTGDGHFYMLFRYLTTAEKLNPYAEQQVCIFPSIHNTFKENDGFPYSLGPLMGAIRMTSIGRELIAYVRFDFKLQKKKVTILLPFLLLGKMQFVGKNLFKNI